MVKLISLLKRKEGLSREEFARWAIEEHAPIGERMPGIRQYRINILRADAASYITGQNIRVDGGLTRSIP